MSQALHTSSTGINAGQSQINVIANNVANINTTAFKAANMTFETLYSTNLSYGSAATKDGGGTNPKQIGLGVKIGGISRNFAPGSFTQTGRDMDCMISGTGFFVVKDADGKQYFTRDGVFSIDSNGNLVTQNGMRVVAAKSTYSNSSTDLTIKVPKNIRVIEDGDTNIASKTLEDLNNASITRGVVAATVKNDAGDSVSVSLPVPNGSASVQKLVNDFNAVLGAAGSSVRFSCNKGTISYSGGYIDFDTTSGATTSNFLQETRLGDSDSIPAKNVSDVIAVTVTIQDMANYNDPDTVVLSSTAIDHNGFIVATYSDGSVLTQFVDNAASPKWKFITNEGVVTTGDEVKATSTTLAETSFGIELATMVNQEGLVSINNNLWQWGPDVGEIYYGLANEMCFGELETGGYEGSNVDIATELSNMIMAQRMIQMNSRVFNTASSVMETLAYLGQ